MGNKGVREGEEEGREGKGREGKGRGGEEEGRATRCQATDLSWAMPTSTVRTPREVDRMGPMVLPHRES